MVRVVSVNVGEPREVRWRDRTVLTGIFKEPVGGPVLVRGLNLAGDRQADLSVHGGFDKAVYVYPAEHYPFWREQLGQELAAGMFGENLTIEGLPLEDEIAIGDRLGIGTAEFVVTQPRLPCFKLGIRFDDPQMVKRFLDAGRTGYYLRVEKEGEVQVGDEAVSVGHPRTRVPVSEITRIYAHDRDDSEGLRRLLSVDALPEDWRPFFGKLLADAKAQTSKPASKAAWQGFREFVVRDKVPEAEGIASFHLTAADGAPLPSYSPGQFLTLRVDVPDGRQAVRSYSLSDHATDHAYRITVKDIGLVSGILHREIAVGDTLQVKAPAGRFVLDAEEHDRPVVLVAGGIGITPLLAMLQGLIDQGATRPVFFFYGAKSEAEQPFRDRLARLADEHPNVRLEVCHSANGRRITIELLRNRLPSNALDFYLCGPPPMMEDILRGLEVWGASPEHVHFEAFGPLAVKRGARPGEVPDCGAEVTFARSNVVDQWTRCDSPLLELAEANGIEIEFGCRAGSCGTCVTRLLSGTVDYLHRPGVPLAEDEILPCVAVPTSQLVLDA